MDLGSTLLQIIIPCVIIKSYLVQYSQKRLEDLLESILLAFIGFVISMLISYLLFGKKHRIENFAAAFCNAGFIGIPLAQAVIGDDGVFYMAASVALLNLFQWTYGVYIMTDRRSAISAKAIVKNPVVIAIVLGVLLFVLRIPVPKIVVNALGYLAGMNTPVAMILLGTYMAKLPSSKIFDKRALGCVISRLIIIPLAILLVFQLIPIRNDDIMLATYLAAVTPVGANICVFAQQYDCDYEFSVVTVCLSTLFSCITIPALVMINQLLAG